MLRYDARSANHQEKHQKLIFITIIAVKQSKQLADL